MSNVNEDVIQVLRALLKKAEAGCIVCTDLEVDLSNKLVLGVPDSPKISVGIHFNGALADLLADLFRITPGPQAGSDTRDGKQC